MALRRGVLITMDDPLWSLVFSSPVLAGLIAWWVRTAIKKLADKIANSASLEDLEKLKKTMDDRNKEQDEHQSRLYNKSDDHQEKIAKIMGKLGM